MTYIPLLAIIQPLQWVSPALASEQKGIDCFVKFTDSSICQYEVLYNAYFKLPHLKVTFRVELNHPDIKLSAQDLPAIYPVLQAA